jgi:hypothetical protein
MLLEAQLGALLMRADNLFCALNMLATLLSNINLPHVYPLSLEGRGLGRG